MLSGYDQWKLAYPPEWDDPPICEGCDKEVEECVCEKEEDEEEID